MSYKKWLFEYELAADRTIHNYVRGSGIHSKDKIWLMNNFINVDGSFG